MKLVEKTQLFEAKVSQLWVLLAFQEAGPRIIGGKGFNLF
ncbi:hypothetical protein UF75_5480 [Desulfosporosinus sp. I2]|nr:hypothetical protein UF75_5480 [Desulfosporosinus sp. I2]